MVNQPNTNPISRLVERQEEKRLSAAGRAWLVAAAAAALLLVAFLTSCGSSTASAEDEIRRAEMALAEGDMTTAHSVADKLSSGENLSGLSAKQLARLSMVYMQLADSEGNSDLAANGADCYRRACKISTDSVEEFCRNLPPENAQTAALLQHLVSTADASYSFEDSDSTAAAEAEKEIQAGE